MQNRRGKEGDKENAKKLPYQQGDILLVMLPALQLKLEDGGSTSSILHISPCTPSPHPGCANPLCLAFLESGLPQFMDSSNQVLVKITL